MALKSCAAPVPLAVQAVLDLQESANPLLDVLFVVSATWHVLRCRVSQMLGVCWAPRTLLALEDVRQTLQQFMFKSKHFPS